MEKPKISKPKSKDKNKKVLMRFDFDNGVFFEGGVVLKPLKSRPRDTIFVKIIRKNYGYGWQMTPKEAAVFISILGVALSDPKK